MLGHCLHHALIVNIGEGDGQFLILITCLDHEIGVLNFLDFLLDQGTRFLLLRVRVLLGHITYRIRLFVYFLFFGLGTLGRTWSLLLR